MATALTDSEQKRLEELKDKRVWLHGEDSEKAEYNALKAKTEVTPGEVVPQSGMAHAMPPVPAEDTVTIKKDDLFKMVNEIAEKKMGQVLLENEELKRHGSALEKQVGLGDWVDVGPNKKRSHTATFRLWRENTEQEFGLIVDWKHLRFDYDEKSRDYDKDIYKITLLMPDDTRRDAELPLKDFGDIKDIETVQIIEMDKVQQVAKIGTIRKSPQTRDGYKLSPGVGLEGLLIPASNEWVDQLVTREKITCSVRRKNGQVFSVDSSRLNS